MDARDYILKAKADRIQNIHDSFEKGKEAPIGTVAMHGGKQMKKVGPDKWEPVKDTKAPSAADAELGRLRSAYSNVSKEDLGRRIKKMEMKIAQEKKEDKSRAPGDRRSIAHGEMQRKIKKLKIIYKEK